MKDILMCGALGFGATAVLFGAMWLLHAIMMRMDSGILEAFYGFLFIGTLITIVAYGYIWTGGSL